MHVSFRSGLFCLIPFAVWNAASEYFTINHLFRFMQFTQQSLNLFSFILICEDVLVSLMVLEILIVLVVRGGIGDGYIARRP